MPALPSHRVDLLIVARISDHVTQHLESAFQKLVEMTVIREDGASLNGERVLSGGFRRTRLDISPSGRALYANRAGGFRAHCPSCNATVTTEFVAVVEQWRRTGGGQIACPCSAVFPIEAVIGAPPIAFGGGALTFYDVQSVHLTDVALDLFEEFIPKYQLVYRRG